MRVALVAPYDLGLPGGVQLQVLGLARALAAGGDDVLVVAPGSPERWTIGASPAAGVVAAEGVGWSIAVPANGSRAPVAVSPRAGARTRAALARFRPDVVHVHEPFVPGPALAAARARVAPVVATFHRGGVGWSYRCLGPVLAAVADGAMCLVAASEEALATLEAVVGPGRAVEVLANAVDLGRAGAARHDPCPADRPTVAFVGRHERRKGLEVLLEALRSMDERPDAWIVGDGPLRAGLEARYGGNGTAFLGRADDATAARRVAGADVFVAPSLGGESFGVVLLEAMAAGTAVVASDLAGYRLAAGDAARYVPAGDPDCLAGALAELLADGPGRAALVERGLERAAGYGFEAVAGAYRERYLACSSRRDAFGS